MKWTRYISTFIYILNLCLFFSIFINFCCGENILLNKLPNASQYANSSHYKLEYISDESHDTLFSSGNIQAMSNITITFNLDSIYCINDFNIYWLLGPSIYQILISENNSEYSLFYEKITETNEDNTNYYNPNAYSAFQDTNLDFCDSKQFVKNLQLNIINNDNSPAEVIIRDIEAFGYSVYNKIEFFQPQIIPFKSMPEFNIGVFDNVEIRISNNNECVNTYHLDNFYFNELRPYKLCYEKFEQNIIVNVSTLTSLSPNVIHMSSFTELSVSALYESTLESFIGLTDANCNANSVISITNIIDNKVQFFDKGNQEGIFNVCYKIHSYWGLTDLSLRLVKPIIYSINGLL